MQKVPEPNPAVHCEGYSVESSLFSSWWGSSRCHPTTLQWQKLKESTVELTISSVSRTRVDCTDPASTWHLWPITEVEIKVCIHPSGLCAHYEQPPGLIHTTTEPTSSMSWCDLPDWLLIGLLFSAYWRFQMMDWVVERCWVHFI